MFASIMGIRAILWHQGETDAERNRPNTAPNPNINFNYYKPALDSLIAQSRSDFKDANNNNQINLQWYISKVSHWRSYFDDPNPGWNNQTNSILTNKQGLVANSNHLGADTDGIGMQSNTNNPDDSTRAKGSYNVHFSDYGLRMLADSWLAAQPWNATPILGKPLLPVTITNVYPSFLRLEAPTGYAKYYWVVSGDRLTQYVNDKQSILVRSSDEVTCYVSKSDDINEMNFFACQPVATRISNGIKAPKDGLSCQEFAIFDGSQDDFNVTPTQPTRIAENVINATNVVRNNGTKITYQAGSSIILEKGFEAKNGTTFKAEIAGCQSAVIQPWSSVNVGNGSGSSTFSNLTLSINGNGLLGGTSDNLHYYNSAYSGDVTIVARIDAISAINGHRAGIMIRNSINANAGFYELIIDGNGNAGKLKRKNIGDIADIYGYAQCPLSGSWLKIVKIGNTIECYIKYTDSSNWLPLVGWDNLADNNFSNNYQIGFIAYNGASAIFSNISVNGIPVN